MRCEDIDYEPTLVEAVVVRELERRPPADALRARYRRAIDETYLHDGPRRIVAVRDVHEALFRQLGWPAFFSTLLADLLSRVAATGVARADRDEGCFVDARQRLQVRLDPCRFDDREALRRYLRHELVHAADMLEAAFGYREEPVDEPTRRRYAALWCASVEARLRGEAAEPVTHAGLLQRARQLGRPRCPLCQLPTARWSTPSLAVAHRIRREYPHWSPEQGVCERCAEWAELTADTA